MSRRLLVVGFGPFPRVPRNPSGLLAQRIAASPRWRRLDIDVTVLVMRTAYAAIDETLGPALTSRPDAVLMMGVATRAKRIRVEARARNRVNRLFPDAFGSRPKRLTLQTDGPDKRASRATAQSLMVLRRSGLDAAISRDAGRYLCNASYYRTLAEPCPSVFLHIPLPRDPHRPCNGRRRVRERTFESWVRAFEQVAEMLLRRAHVQSMFGDTSITEHALAD